MNRLSARLGNWQAKSHECWFQSQRRALSTRTTVSPHATLHFWREIPYMNMTVSLGPVRRLQGIRALLSGQTTSSFDRTNRISTTFCNYSRQSPLVCDRIHSLVAIGSKRD